MRLRRLSYELALGMVYFFYVPVAVPSSQVYAQQTIMNVPSADVTDKGHAYFRGDSFYQSSPAAYNFNGNLAVGLGYGLEVDFNGINVIHSGQQSAVMPGFKLAPYKAANFELYVGDQLMQPLSHKLYARGNFVYAAGAYLVDKLRLTAGAWDSSNMESVGNHGNQAGVLFGIEYTAKSFRNGGSLVPCFDWESGYGLNGYSSFGMMYYPSKRLMILPAYDVGNRSATKGNRFAALFIGIMF
jgi:hypothetical protein